MASSNLLDLIFQAVTQNSVSNLQKVRDSYGLKAIVTNLFKCNEQNETPVQLAIMKESFFIVKWFVGQLKESFLLNLHKPQCSFAISQMISTQQFPIIEFIVYLVETKHPHSSPWLEFVANIIKSSSITQCKKIVGLELIGTLFIFPLNTLGNIHTSREMALNGLHRWKDSLTLRLSLPDGDLAALKIDAVLSEVAQKALTNQIQEMSIAELEQQLISFQEPMEDWRFLCDTLRIRALLMTQRILNQFNSKLLPSSPYLFHLKNLLEYARDCSSRNQFSRATNIYLLIMEQSIHFNPKTSSSKCIDVFIGTLHLLSKCFNKMENEPVDNPEREEFSAGNLLMAITFCTVTAKFLPVSSTHFYIETKRLDFMTIFYKFVLMLVQNFPELNEQENEKLDDCLTNYFRRNVNKSTFLLHAALNDSSRPLDAISLKTIQLFLKLGADPDAVNEYGKTPLLLLAEKWDPFSSQMEWYMLIFQAFIDAGSHLDTARPDGETVLTILRDRLKKNDEGIHPYFDSVINSVLPLSCYCARVIRQHGITFHEAHQLPLGLSAFVSCHSAKVPTSSSFEDE